MWVNLVPKLSGYPVTHMGHVIDLCPLLGKMPGRKIIALSKHDCMDNDFRRSLLLKQLKSRHYGSVDVILVDNVGEAIHEATKYGTKINLVLGNDRADFAERVKNSILSNSFKEADCSKIDEVMISLSSNRDLHGMSGTKLREAAYNNDIDEFFDHIGVLDFNQCVLLADDISNKITNGLIKVKR